MIIVSLYEFLALFTVFRENIVMNIHKNTRLTPYHREENLAFLYLKNKHVPHRNELSYWRIRF